jgi:hypothetical protein
MGLTIIDDEEDCDVDDGKRRGGVVVTPEYPFTRRASSLLAEMYEDHPKTITQFVFEPSLDAMASVR